MKKILLPILLIIFLVPTLGHTNYMFMIDLEYDEEQQAGVLKAAQEYLDVTGEPKQWDYDRELIVVKYNTEKELSVQVHPIDYRIFGFRDDSLLPKGGKETYDQEKRKEIAQNIFENMPKEQTAELRYGGETKDYTGAYVHSWYRYVDDILVIDEQLSVEVNAETGDVVAWRMPLFLYTKEQMETTPAISADVAVHVAEISSSGKRVEYTPVLIIRKDTLVWVTKVKTFYPVFVGINALDGSTAFFGSLPGDIPEGYVVGKEREVIESDFVKKIYGGT